MSVKTHLRSGTLLPSYAVVGGYGMLAASVFYLIGGNLLVGPLFLLLGLIAAFSVVGVEFDPSQDRFRRYTQVLFIRSGQWLKLSDYPDVAIVRRNFRANRNVGLVNMGSTVHQIFDLVMLNKPHLKKVELARFYSQEEAERQAPDLASRFGLRLTDLNPQVSHLSRMRR